MDFELDRGIAVEPHRAGGVRRRLDGGWVVGGGLNGGYLLAVIGNAIRTELTPRRPARPGQRQRLLPDPDRARPRRRAGAAGPRRRQRSTVAASLVQQQDGARSSGSRRSPSTGPRPDADGGPARDPAPGPAAGGGLRRGAGSPPRRCAGCAPLLERFGTRLDPAYVGWALGQPSGSGHHPGLVQAGRRPAARPDRAAAGRRRAAAGDLRPRPARAGRRRWSSPPTCGPGPPPGWAIVRHATRNISGASSRRTARSGTPTGRLVAQSRQLALLPRTLNRRSGRGLDGLGPCPGSCAFRLASLAVAARLFHDGRGRGARRWFRQRGECSEHEVRIAALAVLAARCPAVWCAAAGPDAQSRPARPGRDAVGGRRRAARQPSPCPAGHRSSWAPSRSAEHPRAVARGAAGRRRASEDLRRARARRLHAGRRRRAARVPPVRRPCWPPSARWSPATSPAARSTPAPASSRAILGPVLDGKQLPRVADTDDGTLGRQPGLGPRARPDAVHPGQLARRRPRHGRRRRPRPPERLRRRRCRDGLPLRRRSRPRDASGLSDAVLAYNHSERLPRRWCWPGRPSSTRPTSPGWRGCRARRLGDAAVASPARHARAHAASRSQAHRPRDEPRATPRQARASPSTTSPTAAPAGRRPRRRRVHRPPPAAPTPTPTRPRRRAAHPDLRPDPDIRRPTPDPTPTRPRTEPPTRRRPPELPGTRRRRRSTTTVPPTGAGARRARRLPGDVHHRPRATRSTAETDELVPVPSTSPRLSLTPGRPGRSARAGRAPSRRRTGGRGTP